jgi:hypothetical protein
MKMTWGAVHDVGVSQRVANAWLTNHEFCLDNKPEAGRLRLIVETLRLRALLPGDSDGVIDCWGALVHMTGSLFMSLDPAFICPIMSTTFKCDHHECPYFNGTRDPALHAFHLELGVKGRLSFQDEISNLLEDETMLVQQKVCYCMSALHFKGAHINRVVDGGCHGLAVMTTSLLSLPPYLPIQMGRNHHNWKPQDIPNYLLLPGPDGAEKYHLKAIHLFNSNLPAFAGNHFTGTISVIAFT